MITDIRNAVSSLSPWRGVTGVVRWGSLRGNTPKKQGNGLGSPAKHADVPVPSFPYGEGSLVLS